MSLADYLKLGKAGAGVGRQLLSKVLPTGQSRILANLERSAPEMLKRAGQADTGFTWDPRTGKFLEPGRQAGSMMGSVPNLPGQTSGAGTVRNIDELLSAVKKPETMQRLQRGEYLGAWNPDGAGVGLDPSARFLTRAGAIKSGLKTDQIGGFDLGRSVGYDVTPAALTNAQASLLKKTANTGLAGIAGGGAVAAADYLPDRELNTTAGRIGAGIAGTGASLLTAAALKGRGLPTQALPKAGMALERILGPKKGMIAGGAERPTTLSGLLAATKAEGKGTTNPSDFANKVVAKLKDQVKTETVTSANGKSKQVKTLTFGGETGGKYPEELKALGLQPIMGHNYADTGSAILKTDLPSTLEVLKSNIRALAGKGGSKAFYTDINQALKSSTDNVLPGDRLGGAFAPFSAGASVPANARLAQRFLENPELFPGRFPGEGTLTAGGAWRSALKSAGNENPLAPANFNAKGDLIKIGSFAENVGIPEVSRAVTVDRHAVQAALGVRPISDDVIPDLSNPKVYGLFKQAYDDVAAELGMMPHELQSEVWDIWRRMMVKNPGASLPAEFVPTAKVSDLFKLPPAKFKTKMVDLLSKNADDKSGSEAFIRAAGLID